MKHAPATAPAPVPSAALLAAVPFAVTLAVYLPALAGGVVWDDIDFLRDSPLYRDPALWVQALTRPFLIGPDYFRPLAVGTFLIQTRMSGLAELPLHLVNVLLHAANAGLVALLAWRWWDSRARPVTCAAAGLLFGLHPALVEGAAWISGRFDLLATTFVLLALLADRSSSRARDLLTAAAFLAALLCKELAVVLLAVLPALHLATGGPGALRVRVRQYAMLAGAFALYLVGRLAVIGHLAPPAHAYDTGSPVQHLLLVGRSALVYTVATVWPFGTLSPVHGARLPLSPADGAGWAGVAVFVAVLAGIALLVRRARLAGALAASGLFALVPVLNLRPLDLASGAIFASERFLVLPAAFFAMAAAPMLGRALDRLPGRVVVAAWLLASLVAVELTIPHWRSEVTLWTWAARRAPDSALPALNLSRAYGDTGQWERALAEVDRGLRLDPNDARLRTNRAIAMVKLGRVDETARDALRWLQKGDQLRTERRFDEARDAFAKAEQLGAAPEDLAWARACLFVDRGTLDRAAAVLDDALRRWPQDGRLHDAMGMLAERRGDRAAARQHYTRASELSPGWDVPLRHLQGLATQP